MRAFHEAYITPRMFVEEWRRRAMLERARAGAARNGFRGRIQYARIDAAHYPGRHSDSLIVIRVWP